MSGNGFTILDGARKFFCDGQFVWKIAVQEMVPQRRTGTDFAFAAAVVRNKESYAGIRHQMQVAVEVHSVSTVPDDAMRIARLLVESQAHSVKRLVQAKLARVHHLRRFRTKNLRIVELAVLQVSDHEVRHVGG